MTWKEKSPFNEFYFFLNGAIHEGDRNICVARINLNDLSSCLKTLFYYEKLAANYDGACIAAISE